MKYSIPATCFVFALIGIFSSPAWAYQVSGSVTDRDGIALSDVELTVVDPLTETAVVTATTDAEGSYAISIDQGTYDITES